MEIRTRKQLAIFLSKLRVFAAPKPFLEQYPTDSEVAADMLWEAYVRGDLAGKFICDLGAGTGLLGIGALILGGKKVYFLEKDMDAVEILEKNLQECRVAGEIIYSDIKDLHQKADTVVMNPPFGVKNIHMDRVFLLKAFETADTVYSLHKAGSENFLRTISDDCGFAFEEIKKYKFPVKNTMRFHMKKLERINVIYVRFAKVQEKNSKKIKK